jgi:hypothetical protein
MFKPDNLHLNGEIPVWHVYADKDLDFSVGKNFSFKLSLEFVKNKYFYFNYFQKVQKGFSREALMV